MGTAATRASDRVWKVEFTSACSLCEMCVNRCPRGALSARRRDALAEILFDHRLCDGCGGDAYCDAHCPEKAVVVSRMAREGAPAAPVVLIQGEVMSCPSCGALFVPERKLETVLGKQQVRPKPVQRDCPACRRAHLLDHLLSATDSL